MKNKLVCIFFGFYIFSNLSYSLPAKDIKSKLDKKGYVTSKEKILTKVLDLSDSETDLLKKMVCDERGQYIKGDDEDVHNNEFSFNTGVVVINRKDKENIYFVPKENFDVNDVGADFLPVRHNDEELKLIKKMGERIAKIVKSSIVVDVCLYKDESKKREKLKWHQDRFDGISNPDFLLFSVLGKQYLSENKAGKAVQENYIMIGLENKNNLIYNGFVNPIFQDKIKEIKKIEDKTGAGYFIDQRYEKNKKILVHSRDAREWSATRTSMVARITTLDDNLADMFIGSGEGSYEKGFKRIYLSDPEIAKALFENYCENNDLNKRELEKRIEDKEDAQSYYKLMAPS
jgi:hypothetical protein